MKELDRAVNDFFNNNGDIINLENEINDCVNFFNKQIIETLKSNFINYLFTEVNNVNNMGYAYYFFIKKRIFKTLF